MVKHSGIRICEVFAGMDDITAFTQMMKSMGLKSVMKCGECAHCITDEDAPYCVLKPLYTEVALDKECDETNWKGDLMFVKEEEKHEKL